jgi:Ribosomal S13/S15 N-terminal domain
MGRMHSKGKGISSSAIPYSRRPPAWLKTTPDQVIDQICKLAKKGATPSQIGVILRDSHGIAQVRVVTGRSRFNCTVTIAHFHRQQDSPNFKIGWYGSIVLKETLLLYRLLSICALSLLNMPSFGQI